jgi:hypothetical protein
LDSSFDSVFEEQFAKTMKDLPTKLISKIPKIQRRDDSDDYTDDERSETDKEDSSQVDQIGIADLSSQREHLLLEKIDYLTKKLEKVTRGKVRTTKKKSNRMGSQISRMSSLRATSKPNQDVESVKKYMDCIDVNEDDEESMATATLSKPHQKSTERTRKSASNFSFNTIHSPRETSPKKRRSKLRGQNLFADLI